MIDTLSTPRRTATPAPDTVPRQCTAERVLSFGVAALMLLESAGGLLLPGVYQGNLDQVAGLLGNNLVTLFIALPLLLGSAALARRGSLRARLVHLGVVYYALYNNMFYLFGLRMDRFFLVYEGLLVVPAAALILGLSRIPLDRVAGGFSARTPRRWIGSYMLLCSGILAAVWVRESAVHLFTGQVPRMVTDTQWTTNLPAVFDLSMLVTPLSLGAVWLWRSRPWGYVAAAVLLVHCALYPVVLVAVAFAEAAAGLPAAWNLVPLWAVLGAGCILFATLLLAHMKGATIADAAAGAALRTT